MMDSSPKKIGRYEILEEIEEGNIGKIYRARDDMLQRDLVIKRLYLPSGIDRRRREEYIERFYREAKASGSLKHPGIITIYDVGEDDGTPFIAMEYLKGRTLAEDIAERRLKIDEIIKIFSQVCSALDYAHSKGIIHRDIKPSNVFITDDGTTKLLDFGIARLPHSDLTSETQILGSPSYVSPEVIKGETIDGRSDIFSLGVVLYQVITGERAFKGEGVAEIFHKILGYDPPLPSSINPSIPVGFDYIISRSLNKDPRMRYQRAIDMAHDLKRVDELKPKAKPKEKKIERKAMKMEDTTTSERIFMEYTARVKREREGRKSQSIWKRLKGYLIG